MPIKKKGWDWAPVPIDVILSSELQDFDVRVYGYILWRAGEKARAWPGLESMCKDLHCGESTLKDSLSRLQADNWLKRCRRFGHSSMTYIFEKQADCLAFKAELHPADADLQVIRSAENPDIRTDVRSAENPAVDQPNNRPSISRKSARHNENKQNKSKQNMNEWMKADPICKFLSGLPGYNPQTLEGDRKVIVERAYSVEALEYLWTYAQERSDALEYTNPIGLLLKMIESRQQAPAFLALLAERKRQAAIGQQAAQTMAQVEEREERLAAPIVVDASVTQPLPGKTSLTPELVWHAALGELQLEMTRATYDTWVKPAVLLSVNGTWKIGVPNAYAQEWLTTRLMSTVKRVLTGVAGQVVQPEFVVVQHAARD